MTKWFLATYIISVHSKGISSLQLASFVGVTQKTAWFLNHRIREMLTAKAPELLDGIVEVDETYVGGKESNKHASKRTVKGGTSGKAMVLGAVQRNGEVRTKKTRYLYDMQINRMGSDIMNKGYPYPYVIKVQDIDTFALANYDGRLKYRTMTITKY